MASRHRNARLFLSMFLILMLGSAAWAQESNEPVPPQARSPKETSLGALHAPPQDGPAVDKAASVVPRLLTLNGVLRREQDRAPGERKAPGERRDGHLVGILFALYEEQEGGAPLWQEVQNAHLDAQGRYSVLLGSTRPDGLPSDIFTTGQARWLGIQVEGGKEQPRILLVSVPYALKAADAETLGGKPLSSFVLQDAVGPGSSSPQEESKAAQQASLGGGGTPQVTAGTAGRIARFTNSTDLGDSVMFESVGKIGLGTTSPASLLHLSATSPELRLTSTSSASIPQLSFYDGATLSGFFQFRNSGVADPNIFRLGGKVSGSQFAIVTSDTEKVRVTAAGNVGIGTTTPASILHLSATSPELRLTSTSSASIPQLSFYDGATLGGFFQYRNSGVADPNIFSLGGKVAASQLAIFTGGTEKVRVTAAGNVGIGTTAPAARLHVNPGHLRLGTGAASGFVDASDDPQIYSTAATFEGSPNQLGHLVIQPRTSLPRDIVFATSSDGLNTGERMRIRSDGVSVVGSGDFSGDVSATLFQDLAGRTVSLLTTCSSGQIMKWTGSFWACATDATSTGAGGGPVAFSGSNSTTIVSATQNGPGISNPSINNIPPSAIRGDATATTLTVVGVIGHTVSPEGIGVIGLHTATSGDEAGVVGITLSTTGIGVQGEADSATGATVGVQGLTQSTSGFGVHGEAEAETGATTGVSGRVRSTTGGAAGTRGIALGETGATLGVEGITHSTTNLATGVFGEALGNSGEVFGVRGRTASATGAGGVFQNLGGGPSLATWDAANVETFRIFGDGSIQVIAPSANPLIRLFGQGGLDKFHVDNNGDTFVGGTLGVAGNLNVTGNLSKGSGSFKIDHPLDPANKYLSHSFVESPDMKNIYDGVVVLDQHGQAWVQLPDYFEALNKDFRYQLTCVGGYAPVYVAQEIRDGRFSIAGGQPGLKISWQVTGTRQDAYATAYRIPVEELKPAAERGKYLHPELFEKPAQVAEMAGAKSASH